MIKAQERSLDEMCSLKETLFRQRQRLWEVFLAIWRPALIPVTFSGISPSHLFGLAEGFLPLSGASQLILTSMLITIKDPQRLGSFTKI